MGTGTAPAGGAVVFGGGLPPIIGGLGPPIGGAAGGGFWLAMSAYCLGGSLGAETPPEVDAGEESADVSLFSAASLPSRFESFSEPAEADAPSGLPSAFSSSSFCST
jgi:hypothetical protein